MRDLSAVIAAVLASDNHDAFLAYDITLSDGVTVLRGAEAELLVTTVNAYGTSAATVPPQGYTYEARIDAEPDVTFARDYGSPPTGQLVIEDLAHDLGVVVGQLENLLEGATIVLSNCFAKADGTYEADVYLVGVIRDAKAENNQTTVSVIPDTDTRNASVAGRSLTQRCLAIYGDKRCGRPAELIAPGETCSNIFDDLENGCAAKRWQFRFWGVPILRLNASFVGNAGWGQDGGGGDGGRGGHHGEFDGF